MNKLLAYAQLVRLPNTFTAMADIFLGALATGLLLERWPAFLALLAASTLFYWSGMIWNDYFDLQQDRKERPRRPLASGRITPRSAALLATGFMLGGLLLSFLAGIRMVDDALVIRWRSLQIAVALVIAIFLYDGAFKKTFAGPILMGLCRALNILLGLSILGVWPPFWGWLLAIIIGLYIAGVTWFARTEAAAQQSVELISAAVVMFVSLVLGGSRCRPWHCSHPSSSIRRHPSRICSRASAAILAWPFCMRSGNRNPAAFSRRSSGPFSGWWCSTHYWPAPSSARSACCCWLC